MKLVWQSGLLCLALVGITGCGSSKSDSSKPAPQSQDLGAEKPKDLLVDSPLVGKWASELLGIVSASVTFSNSGAGSEQMLSEVFGLDVDLDFHYSIDVTTSPARLTETVSAVRKQQGLDGALTVGSTRYCIFEVIDNNTMHRECSEDDSFPTAFGEDMETFQRK